MNGDLGQQHDLLVGLHDQHQRVTGFFPGQREQETVQLVFRRHWLAAFFMGLRFFMLGIAAPVVVLLLLALIPLEDIFRQAIFIVFLVYLLFVWLFTFIEFLKNELSIMLVTNERLIDIVQTSLFHHQVSEANIDRIQDVLGFTAGMLGTFFDVGKLEIQTAGADPFVVELVKSPHLSARKVLNLQRSNLQQRRRSDGSDAHERDMSPQIRKRATDEALTDAEILALRQQNNPEKRSPPLV